MNKYLFISHFNFDNSNIIPVLIMGVFLPLFYTVIINNISMKKEKLFCVTFLFIIIVPCLTFLAATLLLNINDWIERILVVLAIILVPFMFGFIYYEKCFTKALLNDNKKYIAIHNPPLANDRFFYSANRFTVLFVGYVSRYSALIAMFCFFSYMPLGIILDLKEYPNIFNSILIFMTLSFIVFLFSFAFLRMLVKCKNCTLYILHVEDYFGDYLNTLKYIVKWKISSCPHCNATHILSSKMNQKLAAEKSKEILLDRKISKDLIEKNRKK